MADLAGSGGPGPPDAGGGFPDLLRQLRGELRLSAERHMQDQELLVAKFVDRALAAVAASGDGAEPGPEAPRLQVPWASGGGAEPGPKAPRPQGPASAADGPATTQPPGCPANLPCPPDGPATTTTTTTTVAGDRSVGEQLLDEAKNDAPPTPPSFQRSSTNDNDAKLHLSGLDEDAEIFYQEFKRDNMSNVLTLLLGERAAGCFMDLMERAGERFQTIEEPERTGRLARLVLGGAFNEICILVVLLNAVFITFYTNADFEAMWKDGKPHAAFNIIDIVFLVFYSIELVLKLALHRQYFFRNADSRWNMFDMVLVIFSVGEQVLLVVSSGQGGGLNLQFLRLLRLLKVVKVLRLLRAFHYFKTLRLMMNMLVGSISSFFWSLVMLACIMYIWGILLMQVVVLYLDDDTLDLTEAQRDQIFNLFSSVRRTCLTLWMATTGGFDWSDVYELLYFVSPFPSFLFLCYVTFVMVVAWNIVTSTFVQHAVSCAQPDLDTLMHEQLQERSFIVKDLLELFKPVDKDGSNSISWDEFKGLTEDKKLRAWLEVRGVYVDHVEHFYGMLSTTSEREEVDINTLANACVRMRGVATSVDLHALSFDTAVVRSMLGQQSERMVGMEEALHKLTHSL